MNPDNPDLALLRLGEALKHREYRHVTVTPATHARVNARPGNEWAADLNGVFGWSRPFRAGIVPPPIFELMRQAGVAVAYRDGWRSLVRASTLNGNLYLHSAWPTDEGDAVFFGPDTYRYLAALSRHLAERRLPVRRAVDIGCGAAPGAIELALQLPDAEIYGVDINDAALQLSRINAALAGAPLRVLKSDLLASVDGNFDLIAANPPYLLDPGERSYRHGGGPLGAGLSLAIVETALRRLNPGGTLLLYTGAAIVNGRDLFLEAVRDLLPDPNSWCYQEIDPDVFGEELECEAYAHADRIAAVVLCVRAAP
ncbi:MAG: methyltransferase [Pigmentiphaga sp.]